MRYWFDTEFIEQPCTIDLVSIGIVAEDGREFYAENEWADLSRGDWWFKVNVVPHLRGGDTQMPREKIGPAVLDFIGSDKSPEFWAYYADYDWVVFCWLFGRMVDLPETFPKFCRDLKQWAIDLGDPKLPEMAENEHDALADARWNRQAWDFLAEIQRAMSERPQKEPAPTPEAGRSEEWPEGWPRLAIELFVDDGDEISTDTVRVVPLDAAQTQVDEEREQFSRLYDAAIAAEAERDAAQARLDEAEGRAHGEEQQKLAAIEAAADAEAERDTAQFRVSELEGRVEKAEKQLADYEGAMALERDRGAAFQDGQEAGRAETQGRVEELEEALLSESEVEWVRGAIVHAMSRIPTSPQARQSKAHNLATADEKLRKHAPLATATHPARETDDTKIESKDHRHPAKPERRSQDG